MDRLLKSTEIAEILQCNRDTALTLMRKMRHIDISGGHGTRQELRVWERDFRAWLESRTKEPAVKNRRRAGVATIPYQKCV